MRIIFCFVALLGVLSHARGQAGGRMPVNGRMNAGGRVPVSGRAHAIADERMIPVGQLRIHCIVSGHGAPLLFLHAGFQDLHMWDAQETFFSKNYRVVRIDLPGHGHTEGVDTTLEVADVIRIVMDSLHIGKAAVVGLSLGAGCATELVLAYPERVSKLILVSPGLSGWSEVMQADSLSMYLFKKIDSIRRMESREAMAEFFTKMWCDGPYRSSSKVDPAARDYIYRTTLQNKMNDAAFPKFHQPGAATRLKEIKCPVLIIRGDKDLPFITGATNWYKHELPDAQLVDFHDVAHMLNLEKPVEFNKVLKEWLVRGKPSS